MFTKIGNSTKVISELNFDSKEDLDKILKTGFEEGFSKDSGKLEELLAQ